MLGTLAYRNLFRNKRRTLITAASILFAVFFALLMRSLQYGAYENMIKNVTFYYGYAQVHHKDYWKESSFDNTFEPSADLESQLLRHSNVSGLAPRIEGFALAASESITKAAMVTGVEIEEEEKLINFESKIRSGRTFRKDEKQAILSSGLANFLHLEVGDTLVLLGQGYQGQSAAGKYPICGIVEFGAPQLNSRLVFLPLLEAQSLFAAEGRLSSYILDVENVRRNDDTAIELKNEIPEELTAMTWKEMVPQIAQVIEADNAIGMIALTILYLIIGFGIFGTILMMTRERIYEFGVLISIGMKRWKLMSVMLMEAFFIATIGVIMGIILAYPVLLYFYFNPIYLGSDLANLSQKYDVEPVLHFSLNPEIFLTQGAYVFLIAIIISFYPIYKISKLKVVKALRGTE